MELEAVRGLAAIAVVFHHYFYAFYPALNTGDMATAHTHFEDNIYGTPLALFYAGTFAVAIFFVLSGFVLSIGFFQTHDENIIKKLAASRYLRLMLPALASIIVAFILMHVGIPALMNGVAAITGSSWLDHEWSFDTNILGALYTGTVGIFLHSGTQFNNVLWTMYIEFFGSFLVFALAMLFAKSKYRWIVYALTLVATFNGWFMAFILGMIVADLYAHGVLKKISKPGVTIALLAGVIIFGSFPNARVDGTLYAYFELGKGLYNFDYKLLSLAAAATMLIVAVLTNERMAAWLRRPVLSRLGKYTFSLYLVHLLVLYTVTSGIFSLLIGLGYNKSVFVAFLVTIPVLAGVTFLFERYIDANAIRVAKWVGSVYLGTTKLSMKKIQSPLLAMRRRLRRLGNWRSQGLIDDDEA